MLHAFLLFLDVGLAVEEVLAARDVWGPPCAAVTLAAAAAADHADTVRAAVRTRVRTLSARIRVRPCAGSLTCTDTVQTRPVDACPDTSGHNPGGS